MSFTVQSRGVLLEDIRAVVFDLGEDTRVWCAETDRGAVFAETELDPDLAVVVSALREVYEELRAEEECGRIVSPAQEKEDLHEW